MGKKKKKVKKGSIDKKPAEYSQPIDRSLPTNDSNEFDFGGLPNRDLKKSLGCG